MNNKLLQQGRVYFWQDGETQVPVICHLASPSQYTLIYSTQIGQSVGVLEVKRSQFFTDGERIGMTQPVDGKFVKSPQLREILDEAGLL